MTALGLIILLCLIVLILFFPGEWAAVAVVASVLYTTLGMQIYIGGVNFYAIRFIEVAGFIRIVIKGELRRIKLSAIDRGFLVFQITYLVIYMIYLLMNPDVSERLATRLSFFCDGVLSYFIFRSLFSDTLAFKNFLKNSAFILIPFTALMVMEGLTGKNLFLSLGVPHDAELHMRGTGYRAQASFGVSITAGCFGATMLPLFIASVLVEGKRRWGLIGTVACLLIIIESRSGTPLFSLAAVTIGWLGWRMLRRMNTMRWGIVLFLILIQLIMTGQIWTIMASLGELTGGHGTARADDIVNFVTHFRTWWLMGMSPENMSGWEAPRLDNGQVDMLNEYVSIGIGGGIISLALFIRLILKCFKSLGNSMKTIRNLGPEHKKDELLLWGVGCSLFSHLVAISGVTYWDQMYVIWYMALAAVSSLTVSYLMSPKLESKEAVYDEGPAAANLNVLQDSM